MTLEEPAVNLDEVRESYHIIITKVNYDSNVMSKRVVSERCCEVHDERHRARSTTMWKVNGSILT